VDGTTEFRSTYETMSDGELLAIAADRQDLMDEAIDALDAELVKRGLREADARKFKRNVDRIEARDMVGHIGLSGRGMGKQFIGASNYSVDQQARFEEFDSTLWFFALYLPILPLSTVRIRRRVNGKSIFWSFGGSGYTALESKGIDFAQVAITYVGAAASAYLTVRFVLFLFNNLLLH